MMPEANKPAILWPPGRGQQALELSALAGAVTRQRARADRAEADAQRLRALLRELEWAGDPNQGRDYCPVCPTCRGYRPETDDEPVGHVPGCRLAAELRGG